MKNNFFIIIIIIVCFVVVNGCINDSSNGVSDVSINGMKLGNKASSRMKQIVMDGSFKYKFKNVGFDVDDDSKIISMTLYSATYADGKVVYDLTTENIRYAGKRLKTIEDFKNAFGEGTLIETKYGNNELSFVDEKAILTLSIDEDNQINVYLEYLEQ